jgi:hypothetical protein
MFLRNRKWGLLCAVCLALPLILSFVGTAAAQSAGTGTISGHVADEKGGAVAGAKVSVRNMDTNIAQELTTNADGDYRAVFLPPGNYEVTVQVQGFATLKHPNIHLAVGATLTVDATLKVASITEVVTVTGGAPLIEPEKIESSQVVGQNLIQNLPINGRRWTDFALLTPGASADGGFGLVSYRGISSLYSNNTVDGADNNQAFFSEARGRTRAVYAYSLQTIKEFQVTASNYSAEFGRSAGGIINAVTKSGTDQFHGGAFWYLRNFHANALDPFTKGSVLQSGGNSFVKPIKQRNQFGADFGGPLVKSKLFFYFAYDGNRQSNPGTTTASSGFFSTTGANTANCPALATAAQCTAAVAYLQSLAKPFGRTGTQDIYFGKMDYQINSNNRLSGSINWHTWNSPNGFLTGSSTSSDVSNNGLDIVRSRFLVIDLSSAFHSNMANDLRFQYGQDFEAGIPNGPGPSVGMTNGITYGENTSLPRTFFPDERRYQLTDTYSIVSGKHSWKMGFDVNLVHEKLANLFQGGGTYFFSTSTILNGLVSGYSGTPCASSLASAAFAFCNWVLDVYQIPTVICSNTALTTAAACTGGGGTVVADSTGKHYNNITQAADPITGIGLDDFWQNNFGGFIQDTWKIFPKFTLNYGLRYDIQVVPQPPKPNLTTPLAGLLTSRLPIDKNNWGPRIGIGWEIFPKTLVRAGYGLYYGQTSNSVFYTVRVENGVFQQTYSFSSSNRTGAPVFPNLIFTPPGPPVAAPFSGAATPQVINTNPSLGSQIIRGVTLDFVNPLVHMAELVVERELGWNSSFSATYLASRGLRLPVFVDANLAPSTTTRTYDVVDGSGTTLSTVTVPLYTARSPQGTGGGVLLLGKSVVNSWYHGLVLNYTKRFSHGFETLANYTFSKSIDTGQVIGTNGTFNGTNTPLDPNNIGAEKALSDLDQRNRFSWSFIYATQFDRSQNAVVRHAFGGWSFSGILTLASGRPVTAGMSGSAPSCTGVDGGATCAEVSSFGSATSGRAPQLGRNIFTSPGITVFDFRVGRDIKLAEKYQLRILVEAFNLTNTTNVTGVTSSAFSFVSRSATSSTCNTATHANNCIAPFTGTPFLTPSSTSNSLIGPRQMQLSVRFTF